jgi:hypothetical protein
LSFKVFPRPRATVTLRFDMSGVRDAVEVIAGVVRGPIGLDAADIEPDGTLVVRLGGAPQTLRPRAARLETQIGRSAHELTADREASYWADVAEFGWAGAGAAVVRVPVTGTVADELHRSAAGADGLVRFGLAANVAWIAWPESRPLGDLDLILHRLQLTGSVLTASESGTVGVRRGGAFADRIHAALDPFHRFAEV